MSSTPKVLRAPAPRIDRADADRHATFAPRSGCEFAGELSDFVANDLAPRYGEKLVSEIRVSLLQSGKSLLTQFEASLQTLALDNFAGRVNVVFGARVTEVTEHDVILQSGESIRYGILIWAAGNGTRPIVANIVEKVTGEPAQEARDKRRKIPVDPWLRVKGMDYVFAVGDCASVEGEPLPSTAQVAGQQGAFLGSRLRGSVVAPLLFLRSPRMRSVDWTPFPDRS